MEQEPIDQTILSIECAVGDGSIAVVRGTTVLASTLGTTHRPSRAEEVLLVVQTLLKDAHLSLSDVDAIAVSTGPGSYSGIRIGIATALGLAKAVSKTCLGVSVLDALASGSMTTGRLTTAVAVGRRHAAWGHYDLSELDGPPKAISDPSLESDDEFISQLDTQTPLLWSADLSLRLANRLPHETPAGVPEKSTAELIGSFAARFPHKTSLAPQYLRDQQVAKARQS